jgi:hypothetical protein
MSWSYALRFSGLFKVMIASGPSIWKRTLEDIVLAFRALLQLLSAMQHLVVTS